MDVLARLSWVDVMILMLLALGVFIGFSQGILRYVFGLIRETVIPSVGFVARPFVPREIAQLLLP